MGMPEVNRAGQMMSANMIRGGMYANRTLQHGAFTQAMSQISCNPSSAAQGSGLDPIDLNKKLFEQLQLALAVKMGLNGPQQVKERALHNVFTSKSAGGEVNKSYNLLRRYTGIC